jgi:transcription antitermination factor NusG
MRKKEWHVIYSKPRSEKKVDIALQSKGVISWCPLNKVRRQWTDRVKVIQEPLFKSYVFVYIDFEKEREVIKNTPGFLQFVYYLGKPAIIKEKEIEEIKSYLCLDDVSIKVSALDSFSVNDEVVISRGVFKNASGKIIRQVKHKVLVKLESLGQVLIVEFGIESIKAV